MQRSTLFPFGPLGIVRGLILPRQFIERRLIISRPISVFRDIEFLMLVVFDAGTILIAPAVPFSVQTARFHSAIIQPGKQFANADKMKSPTRADIHFGRNGKVVMFAVGQNQTFWNVRTMSAIPPETGSEMARITFGVVGPATWRCSPRSILQHRELIT